LVYVSLWARRHLSTPDGRRSRLATGRG
jgi:hypothetical protein